jgi:hypothetical protein
MKTPLFYRIASVLLVLFAAGHTLGFTKVLPEWGVDSLVGSMKSMHFVAQGFTRSYWDFYVGFGLFATVFLLFAGVLCWQLAGLNAETLRSIGGICWTLAACFVAIAFMSWKYFFIAPIVFSSLVALCLVAAAGLSASTNT